VFDPGSWDHFVPVRVARRATCLGLAMMIESLKLTVVKWSRNQDRE